MKSTAKKRITLPKEDGQQIKYGNADLLAKDEFSPKHGKQRMTMFIDMDLLQEIRARAEKEEIGYQTWINRELRRLVFDEKSLEDRLAALEKAVFKKGA